MNELIELLKSALEVIVWSGGLLLLWIAFGFGIVREDERLVKIFLGRPYGVSESGVVWVPFLIGWVRRYTTKVVELQIVMRNAEGTVMLDSKGRPVPAGGFITAGGEITMAGNKKKVVGPVNLGVTLSFRFNWPWKEAELFRCVKLLPKPDEKGELTDLFQEIIMEETRSVGCKMTYLGIMSDRSGFADQIKTAALQGKSSQLFTETGLESSAHVVIDHIDIPDDTVAAIDNEEASRLRAEGVRREAEGKKDAAILDAEGRAVGYRAIKAEGPEAMQLEELRTLREMAQGTSNTIFFPLEAIQKLFANFRSTK